MAMSAMPFLFIHGAGGTQEKWRAVQPLLTAYGGSYIDLPGHGANHDLALETIEAYAHHVSTTLQDDAVLVGHSMGGLIGIETAIRNKHVKGLMLVASHFQLPVHPKILSKLAEGEFPESLFYASYAKQARPELLVEEKEQTTMVTMETTRRDFAACNSYVNGASAFAKLDIPILALYGAEDRLLPAMAADEVMAANGHAQTKVVAGSGHYVMLEQPGAFVEALVGFRRRIV